MYQDHEEIRLERKPQLSDVKLFDITKDRKNFSLEVTVLKRPS